MHNCNACPCIRPPPFLCVVCEDGDADQHVLKGAEDEEEIVDLKYVMFHDPIVGVEQIVETEHGPGAREAKPLPSPPTFTPAQRAKHCLTHLPFHPGCPMCVACRQPNTHHR